MMLSLGLESPFPLLPSTMFSSRGELYKMKWYSWKNDANQALANVNLSTNV